MVRKMCFLALFSASLGCSSSEFVVGSAADSAGSDVAADLGTPDSTTDTGSPVDTGTSDVAIDGGGVDAGCLSKPFDGTTKLPSGAFLCGVGPCRQVVSGGCKMTPNDAGVSTPCGSIFPGEVAGNGKDDDCNGVIDDGYKVAQSPAGFECKSCAYGRKVRRKDDGTLDTITPGDSFTDYENNPGCINSDLCKLGTADWVRHAGYKGTKTCADFCASIGGSCKPLCSTSSAACKAEAVKSGLGTFAADYKCMSPTSATPLVGGCDTTFVDAPASNAFNVYCCCGL